MLLRRVAVALAAALLGVLLLWAAGTAIARPLSPSSLLLAFGTEFVAGLPFALGFFLRKPLGARERRAALEAIVRGDLGVRLSRIADARGELSRLLTGIRRVILELSRISAGVQRTAAEVDRHARDIAGAAHRQSQELARAGQAGLALEETRAAISQRVEEIAVRSRDDRESADALGQTAARVIELLGALDAVATRADQEAAELSNRCAASASGVRELGVFALEARSWAERVASEIEAARLRAQETFGLAREVATSAGQGKALVGDAVAGLHRIEGSIRSATELVADLGERSGQIGRVVDVIDEIADQTNLLALNAAIIASGAGEQGRAFAVVAEEIRGLAERTARSTREIANLVGGVQGGVEATVALVRKSSEDAEAGVRLGERAAEALARIGHASERTARAVEGTLGESVRLVAEGARLGDEAVGAASTIGRVSAAATQAQEGAVSLRARLQELGARAGRMRTEGDSLAKGGRGLSARIGALAQAVDALRAATRSQEAARLESEGALRPLGEDAGRLATTADSLGRSMGSLRYGARALTEQLARFRLPAARRGGALRMAFSLPSLWETSRGFDPIHLFALQGQEISHLIYEGLVQPADAQTVVPALAREWEVADGGRTFRFRLRAGARFHDGNPLDADAVLRHFERALLGARDGAAGGALVRSTFEDLEGLAAFLDGSAPRPAGFQPLAPDALEVRFARPRPFFLHQLALDPCRVGHLGPGGVPIGSGPFKVASSIPGKSLSLVRAEERWDAGSPNLERLEIRLDIPPEEMGAAIREGRADVASFFPRDPTGWGALGARGLLASVDSLDVQFLAFHCKTPPVDDPRVRRAVRAALDLPEFWRVQGGGERLARSVVPEALLGVEGALAAPGQDLDLARRLLREAGHDKLELRLVVSRDRPLWTREAEILFRRCPEVGLCVRVEEVDDRDYWSEVCRGRAAFFRAGWHADYPDADAFLHPLFHADAQEFFDLGFRNDELDKLVAQARETLDADHRTACYRRVERIVGEEVPVIPLYHSRQLVAFASQVQGLRLYPTPPMVRPVELWLDD